MPHTRESIAPSATIAWPPPPAVSITPGERAENVALARIHLQASAEVKLRATARTAQSVVTAASVVAGSLRTGVTGTREELPEVRRAELAEACAILGVGHLVTPGLADVADAEGTRIVAEVEPDDSDEARRETLARYAIGGGGNLRSLDADRAARGREA